MLKMISRMAAPHGAGMVLVGCGGGDAPDAEPADDNPATCAPRCLKKRRLPPSRRNSKRPRERSSSRSLGTWAPDWRGPFLHAGEERVLRRSPISSG